MKKLIYVCMSISCFLQIGAAENNTLVLFNEHPLRIVMNSDLEAAYKVIGDLSDKSHLSNMKVALTLKPIVPIVEKIVKLQDMLFCWDNENALDVLQEAKKNKVHLDFTYDKIDPVSPSKCFNIVTPLLQLAKQAAWLGQSISPLRQRYNEISKWFIKNGAGLNVLDEIQSNALMIAINYGNQPLALCLVEDVVDSAINIDQQDYKGETALFLATISAVFSLHDFRYSFALDIMEKLIKRGANPFLKGNAFCTDNPKDVQNRRTPREYVEYYIGEEYHTDKTRAIVNILKQAEARWIAKE